ncbi:DNA topoisomerase 2 [Hordeum vulgare]|nr:DNA topoisomerase 2 [Hordeum vulgare]
MYFGSAGPGPRPPPPAEQGPAAPLPLEVADPPPEEQLAPLLLEVADPLAEDQAAALEQEPPAQEKAPPESDNNEEITSLNVNGQHMVIPSLVVTSLKDIFSVPRTGSLTLEIGLDSEDDDIYVSIPCWYFIGLGGRMVFKEEGFSNFLRVSSIEVNNLVLITIKERDQELAVIFNLLPQ